LSLRNAPRCEPYGVVFPEAFPDGQATVGPLPPGAWHGTQGVAGLCGLAWHPPLADRQFRVEDVIAAAMPEFAWSVPVVALSNGSTGFIPSTRVPEAVAERPVSWHPAQTTRSLYGRVGWLYVVGASVDVPSIEAPSRTSALLRLPWEAWQS